MNPARPDALTSHRYTVPDPASDDRKAAIPMTDVAIRAAIGTPLLLTFVNIFGAFPSTAIA